MTDAEFAVLLFVVTYRAQRGYTPTIGEVAQVRRLTRPEALRISGKLRGDGLLVEDAIA